MRAKLLSAWRSTANRHGRERAIVEAATGASVTFAELAARATAWRTRHLGARDDLRGRIAVFGIPNGIAWFEAFLGFMEAGVVVGPLDPGEPAAAQRESANRLGAALLWDGSRLLELDGRRRYTDPSVCLIKLTSGSTGIPRALPFTHAQMLADTRQIRATMDIHRPDLVHGLIPLGHSYGLAHIVVPLVAGGIHLVCGSSALPHAIAEEFVRWRPTVFPTVPTVWRALAASAVEPSALASLRLAISAGAPLPAEVEETFAARFGKKICSFYGSTETGGISYDASGRAAREGHVGRPLKGVRIRPAKGGRIVICSPAVFTVGNRRRAGIQGCWIPPDRAGFDAKGRVVLSGRRGSIVKIGGRRINLQEIATRIKRIPGVRDAWITALGAREPVVAAAVATDLASAALRGAMHADTAGWKIPKKWLILPELPVTARGKLDTRALKTALA